MLQMLCFYLIYCFSTQMFLRLCFKVKFTAVAHHSNSSTRSKNVFGTKLIKADLSRETKERQRRKKQSKVHLWESLKCPLTCWKELWCLMCSRSALRSAAGHSGRQPGALRGHLTARWISTTVKNILLVSWNKMSFTLERRSLQTSI